jgi:hypothetical protein
MIVLDRCFDLAVHHDAAKGVVVLEYASDGHVVGTGRRYSPRTPLVGLVERTGSGGSLPEAGTVAPDRFGVRLVGQEAGRCHDRRQHLPVGGNVTMAVDDA